MSSEVLSWGANEVLERVREDPDLHPEEKETTLRFAKDQDVVHTFTSEAALSRRFLAHPLSTVHEAVLQDGRMVSDPGATTGGEASIVGVRGTLPIGVLKVGSKERTTAQHAPVFSKSVLADGSEDEEAVADE